MNVNGEIHLEGTGKCIGDLPFTAKFMDLVLMVETVIARQFPAVGRQDRERRHWESSLRQNGSSSFLAVSVTRQVLEEGEGFVDLEEVGNIFISEGGYFDNEGQALPMEVEDLALAIAGKLFSEYLQ